jgi:hypothetical protein
LFFFFISLFSFLFFSSFLSSFLLFFNFKCFHKSTFDRLFVLLNICLKTCLFLTEISPPLISFIKWNTYIYKLYQIWSFSLDKLILWYSNPTQSHKFLVISFALF